MFGEYIFSKLYMMFFFSIVTQKRKVGTIAPKKFIARLRKEKIEFDNYMQQVKNEMTTVLCCILLNCLLCQDAHEFLIFLINHINEIIVGEQSPSASNGCRVKSPGEADSESSPTWINEIFQVRKHSLERNGNNIRTIRAF